MTGGRCCCGDLLKVSKYCSITKLKPQQPQIYEHTISTDRTCLTFPMKTGGDMEPTPLQPLGPKSLKVPREKNLGPEIKNKKKSF